MKIYLAGKVSKYGDWRAEIIGGRQAEWLNVDEPWKTRPGIVLGKHDYTGPFFIGCDHGCYHGATSHGMRGTHDSYECSEIAPTAEDIVDQCLEAMRRSDLVFAWIDSPDAYGTLIEIGYAFAAGIPVAVAVKDGLGVPKKPEEGQMSEGRNEFWFAGEMGLGQRLFHAETAKVALLKVLQFHRQLKTMTAVAGELA